MLMSPSPCDLARYFMSISWLFWVILLLCNQWPPPTSSNWHGIGFLSIHPCFHLIWSYLQKSTILVYYMFSFILVILFNILYFKHNYGMTHGWITHLVGGNCPILPYMSYPIYTLSFTIRRNCLLPIVYWLPTIIRHEVKNMSPLNHLANFTWFSCCH